MDNAPYDFIIHSGWDDKPSGANLFKGFVHRTFNEMDLLHLLNFLQFHYRREKSLETAFTKWMQPGDENIENGLIGFHNYVFAYNAEAREEKHCRKHISSPGKKICLQTAQYVFTVDGSQ